MTQLSRRCCKVSQTIVCQVFIAFLILIGNSESLRCRTDDGPSEAELKRVARSCMRKFGENAFNMQSNQQNNQQSHGNFNQRNNRNGYSSYPDYGDSQESYEANYDDGYRSQYSSRNYQDQNNRNSNNNNNRGSNGNGYNYGGRGGASNNDDNLSGNNDRNRQRSSSNQNQNRSNGNNQGSQQNNHSGNNNNDNNNRNNNNNSNNNNTNRNNNNNNGNRNYNSNNNSDNSNNNNNTYSACIAHCFFDELHMLNKNNYPDRHKVIYVLTKDMRDRELRNFYTDTIQECFRYIESQRRREKCIFSRDLISCMTEYAKGNCEDWNEFSTLFN